MTNDVTQLTPDAIRELIAERDALRKFKEFVHSRLDVACVPAEPNGLHTERGCRVGDRLDIGLAPYEAIGAAEGKYGVITASNKAFHPGEPVFLIRATDPFAHDIIKDYAEYCRQNECSPEHVEAAHAHAERIRHWQRKNLHLVKKLPD